MIAPEAQNDSIMQTADRWSPMVPCATVIGAFCAILLCGIPGWLSLLLIPILVLGGLPLIGGLLFWGAILAVRRQRRRAVSVVAAAILPVLLWGPINWMAGVAHLGLTVGLGIGTIRGPMQIEGRFQAYDWSVGLVTSPTTFLIHDPTDGLARPLPPERQRTLPDDSIERLCAGTARYLVGHYYECTFYP